MFLGESFPMKESLQIEFKEFCLKNYIYDYYDKAELYNIVSTGKLDEHTRFNKLIYDSLLKYITYYIPKYASAFSNCDVYGSLYIGINDYGEITGVPFIGNIDINILNAHLKYVMDTNLRIVGSLPKAAYTDLINIEIMELEINMRLLNDTSDDALKYMHSKCKRYHEKYESYMKSKEHWYKELYMCTCKLEIILNNKKDELLEYIRSSPAFTPECDCVIQYLVNNNGYIKIDLSNIEDAKDDPKQYLSWLFKFKDDIVEEHLSKKPKAPHPPTYHQNIPYTLITQMSNLRHKFLTTNPEKVKYYLLKINLPCNIQKECYLEYKHYIKDIWDFRTRTYTSDTFEPCLA